MAKRRKSKSLSGTIRQYLTDHPEWLSSQDTSEIVAQFEKDHPKKKVDKYVMQAIYNVKSSMRKGPTGAAKRQQSKAAARHIVQSAAKTGRPSAPLTQLEEMIDDCMILARQINQENLVPALMDLRRARNSVVRIQVG